MKQSEFDLGTRMRAAGILFVIAVVIALVQLTSFAPFPHAIDDYVQGFAVGFAASAAILWLGKRKTSPKDT